MPLNSIVNDILSHLKALIGKKLSIARRAHNLCNFQFGQIHAVAGGTVGEYALHIECPWRIEGPQGIVTGCDDLWEPAEKVEDDFDWDTWADEKQGNLQDTLLEELLGGYDENTDSFVNQTELLTVEEIQADSCGGAMIKLSGGYRLVLFPASSRREAWRLFQPDTNEQHFVISGGRIERDDENGRS